jgi:RNA polymerase-associated protein
MTLYSGPTNCDSHRVRFVLAEKGIAADVVSVDLEEERPGDLVDLNPYGEVPTLVDRDLILYDSKVISEYLDERFPHPPLMPVDPVSRAKARLVIYRIERDWCRLLMQIEAASGKTVGALRQELWESLVSSNEVFASGTAFFLSDELTMMDCALGPLMWRLPHYGVEIPASSEGIHDYQERLFALESFQKSLSEAERAMRA